MKAIAYLVALVPLLISTPPERHFTKEPGVPPVARALLHRTMETHEQATTDLLWSVIFLENDVTAEVAGELAVEPHIARPTPDHLDELNSQLPAAFFDLQDAFSRRAKDLALAAERGDNDAIAARFGELTRSCVACHAVYLNED